MIIYDSINNMKFTPNLLLYDNIFNFVQICVNISIL